MSTFLSIPSLSVKPNYISFYYQSQGNSVSYDRVSVIRKQPKSTNNGRELSSKAHKKLRNKVNWLIELSENKRVYNNRTKGYFNFKVNFITLTLPCLQMHLDTTIKRFCFKPFLDELRKYHGLKNYVWRAECQSNGNIHFHIACDTFINYYYLRSIWNRKVRALGYIDQYRDKLKSLSKSEYIQLRLSEGAKDLISISKAFDYGTKSNWRDPNTTDVHAISKLKNTAAYISKYMSKDNLNPDSDGRFPLKARRIKGRNWGCSESLSRCRSIIIDTISKLDDVFDYCKDILKCKFIKDAYFSILFAGFSDWKHKFKDLFLDLIGNYKNLINYSPGNLSPKCSSVF